MPLAHSAHQTPCVEHVRHKRLSERRAFVIIVFAQSVKAPHIHNANGQRNKYGKNMYMLHVPLTHSRQRMTHYPRRLPAAGASAPADNFVLVPTVLGCRKAQPASGGKAAVSLILYLPTLVRIFGPQHNPVGPICMLYFKMCLLCTRNVNRKSLFCENEHNCICFRQTTPPRRFGRKYLHDDGRRAPA